MGDKNFRLPQHVRPTRYDFVVAPDPAARTFAGRGSIALHLDVPVRSITLHGSRITVAEARARGGSGDWLAARVTDDADSQTLTFTFDTGDQLPAGEATLELSWSGRFQEDLRGLYLAGAVGVTQFEAADARRVFPCFDEPAFKAVWDVGVEAPVGVAVVGNGRVISDEMQPGGARIVRFASTPIMSSYLVALVVGDLVPSMPAMARGVEIRTWATRDKAHLAGFAQDCAAAVLPLLEDYFGLPYAFGKLDQLGIPEFEAGAMENSGCITFREVVLLVDLERAPLPLQKRAAEVITHELAHQWFGNLVTMQWWDDLWLNEAFATWMAFKIVDQWRPVWRMWDDFEAGKAAALHLDAMESTHPIHAEVRNADEATENFDLITYEKGGAMLRMIEGYLGADAFRDGIRDYMRKFEYKNARAADLWAALGRASGEPIVEVADAWIHKAGFPLLDVEREEAAGWTRVCLIQRRFFADPARMKAAPRRDELWPIPVVLRWADDDGVKETRVLLQGEQADVELESNGVVRFICANSGGAGFYRVKYFSDELERLAACSRELTPVERLSVVADAWALFRAGMGALGPVLDLLFQLATDEDYAVLGEVVGRLDTVERRWVEPGNRAAFRALVERTFAPRLAQLGWEPALGESDERRLERAQVVRALALVARSEPVLSELRARLDRYLAATGGEACAALDANLIDTAHVAVARAGDSGHFDRLLARLPAEADPAARRRCLVALASFEEPPLIDRALDLLPTDVVPMQDVATFLGTLLAGRGTQDAAFARVQARWAEVHKKAAAPMLLRRVVESLGELAHRRGDVEALLAAQAAALAAVPQGVRQTLERLRLDEEVRARAVPALSRWLAGAPARA